MTGYVLFSWTLEINFTLNIILADVMNCSCIWLLGLCSCLFHCLESAFYSVTNDLCFYYLLYVFSLATLLPCALLSRPVSAQCQSHSQSVPLELRMLRWTRGPPAPSPAPVVLCLWLIASLNGSSGQLRTAGRATFPLVHLQESSPQQVPQPAGPEGELYAGLEGKKNPAVHPLRLI